MNCGVFFINLDRVPDRHAFMKEQFQKIGLEGAVRFSAIDAKVDGSLAKAGFRQGVGERWSLPKSAIACFESHRTVWKLAFDRGLDAALIMEDDLAMSLDLSSAFQSFVAVAESFDVMKLDISPAPVRFGPVLQMGGLDVRPILKPAPSAGAYIVSRTGLEKLLARSEVYGDTLDDFLYTPHEGWRMFQMFPALAAQLVNFEMSEEQQPNIHLRSSERELDPQINQRDLPKGPAWFRLRKEWRRLVSRVLWKFGGRSALERDGGYFGVIPMAQDLRDGQGQ